MALPPGYNTNRLMKRFVTLGPYLREEKCNENRFFFDCLAICVNVKLAPEEREFWGWWLELEARDNFFAYDYHFGLFNKEGDWQPAAMTAKNNHQKLEETWHGFYGRLENMLTEMELKLIPMGNVNYSHIKLAPCQ